MPPVQWLFDHSPSRWTNLQGGWSRLCAQPTTKLPNLSLSMIADSDSTRRFHAMQAALHLSTMRPRCQISSRSRPYWRKSAHRRPRSALSPIDRPR